MLNQVLTLAELHVCVVLCTNNLFKFNEALTKSYHGLIEIYNKLISDIICLDTLGYPSDSRRRAGGFEISLLFCSGRLRRRRSNAAWCLGGGSRAFGVAGSAAWATILTVCYCGAAVLICVISVNLTASVVADRLAARGRSRRDAG